MEMTKQPSTVGDPVDKLRYKSEEELKRLYALFFSNELKEEWKEITQKNKLEKASEEDIIKVIQKKRYNRKDV